MTIKQLYPTQRPALDLNFARQKRLDPRVTFTRGSIATYVSSDGLIKTAADNEARFDHASDGTSLGLLIEEARTNSLTYSGEFDNAAWTKTRMTIVPNAITAPDGTITADKLIRNTDNNINVIYQTVSLAQTTYTFSVFAKQGEYGFCTLVLPATQGWDADRWISVDLTDGSFAVSSSAPTATTVQECPGGWYRISITHAASAAVTRGGYIDARPSSGFSALPGDGTSGIYIWGAQIEAGSFPTSYIPTAGATATRAADVASMTGTNFSSWYNQSEGTVFADVHTVNTTQGGVWGPINSGGIDLGEGFVMQASTAQLRCVNYLDSGSTDNDIVFNSPLVGGNKWSVAGSISDDTTGAYFNGSTGTVNASRTQGYGSVAGVTLGLRSGQRLTGHISRIAYYPVRLSDTQLQALTL